MLAVGRQRHGTIPACEWVEADAQALPFEAERFDAVTISYGIRNLPHPDQGLAEAFRVVKPGGELAILEFGQPRNPVWGLIFSLYSRYGIPFIGALISGSRAPYEYLPSTAAAFPCGGEFEKLLREAGWSPMRSLSLCGGIAYLYLARK
jgi:demethylmenaquinone methyltransferase/2-methoxy-6-polyprenyl-1,4-benzoquinol methylase